MCLPDCAFMTFYYNDGTKETVQAFSYGTALSKLKKDDPFKYIPFWRMGNDNDDLIWDSEIKQWVPSRMS